MGRETTIAKDKLMVIAEWLAARGVLVAPERFDSFNKMLALGTELTEKDLFGPVARVFEAAATHIIPDITGQAEKEAAALASVETIASISKGKPKLATRLKEAASLCGSHIPSEMLQPFPASRSILNLIRAELAFADIMVNAGEDEDAQRMLRLTTPGHLMPQLDLMHRLNATDSDYSKKHGKFDEDDVVEGHKILALKLIEIGSSGENWFWNLAEAKSIAKGIGIAQGPHPGLEETLKKVNQAIEQAGENERRTYEEQETKKDSRAKMAILKKNAPKKPAAPKTDTKTMRKLK